MHGCTVHCWRLHMHERTTRLAGRLVPAVRRLPRRTTSRRYQPAGSPPRRPLHSPISDATNLYLLSFSTCSAMQKRGGAIYLRTFQHGIRFRSEYIFAHITYEHGWLFRLPPPCESSKDLSTYVPPRNKRVTSSKHELHISDHHHVTKCNHALLAPLFYPFLFLFQTWQ
jgi:hypothetical protein